MTSPAPRGTPADALRALQEGNERFLAAKGELRSYSPLGSRHAEGQRPFAAIIACANSRISPALIFDLDRGNLFVSRIAGNSVDTGTLGSTEYADAGGDALGHGPIIRPAVESGALQVVAAVCDVESGRVELV